MCVAGEEVGKQGSADQGLKVCVQVSPHAASGLQHLRIRYDPAVATNAMVGGISPNLGTFTASSAVVSVDVFIIGSDRDYEVIPQSPSEGLVVTRVRFRRLKNIIDVLDDPEGDGSFTFIDTGVAWIADQYINLTIDLNIAANSVDITYNGAVIYTREAVVLGTAVQEVVFVGLNGFPTGYADFDNLDVAAPAPCPWDCGGDFDDNVGIVDFLALLAQWESIGSTCDFHGTGVGITEFLELLGNWGPCP